jgi:hypothetical protein
VAEAGRVRIEVAFEGAHVMGAYVTPDVADELEKALEGNVGSFQIEAEDGRYTLALARVVYVKRFSREGRVGFSGPKR